MNPKKPVAGAELFVESSSAAAARYFGEKKLGYFEWLTTPFNPKAGRERPVPDHFNLDMRHIRAITGRVQAMADGVDDCRFNIITSPPRHYKTAYGLQYAALWLTEYRPGINIMLISATTNRAEDLSKRTRRIGADLGIVGNTSAVTSWTTRNGSSLRWLGAGQSTKGYDADVIIIDDPIESAAAFASEVDRESKWDWMVSDVLDRLQDHTTIMFIYTTGHYDDLGQRLLKRSTLGWNPLRMPIKAEEDDQLGRKPGEWLAPMPNEEKILPGEPRTGVFRVIEYERREREILSTKPSEWWSTYMCRPSSSEGALIIASRVHIVEDEPPTLSRRARAWDLASTTKAINDETVGVYGGMFVPSADPTNQFYHESGKPCLYIGNVFHGRYEPGTRDAKIVEQAKLDGPDVKIRLPKDAGEAGIRTVASLSPALRGFNYEFKPVVGNKTRRAQELATLVNSGRVYLQRDSDNDYLLTQWRQFPHDAHDDAVDASSDLAFETIFSGDYRFPYDSLAHCYDSEYFELTWAGADVKGRTLSGSHEEALIKNPDLFKRWASFMYSSDSMNIGCWMLMFAMDLEGCIYVYDEVALQGSTLLDQTQTLLDMAQRWELGEMSRGKFIAKPVFCDDDFKRAKESPSMSRWAEFSRAGIPMYSRRSNEIEGYAAIETLLSRRIKGDSALMIHERCRFLNVYLATCPRDTRTREGVDAGWIGKTGVDALRVGIINSPGKFSHSEERLRELIRA